MLRSADTKALQQNWRGRGRRACSLEACRMGCGPRDERRAAIARGCRLRARSQRPAEVVARLSRTDTVYMAPGPQRTHIICLDAERRR